MNASAAAALENANAKAKMNGAINIKKYKKNT